jgi:hypothetical protein
LDHFWFADLPIGYEIFTSSAGFGEYAFIYRIGLHCSAGPALDLAAQFITEQGAERPDHYFVSNEIQQLQIKGKERSAS